MISSFLQKIWKDLGKAIDQLWKIIYNVNVLPIIYFAKEVDPWHGNGRKI